MIKQLTKVGNSNALVLDKALMELLGLEENAQVQLVVSDGALIVTPVNPSPIDPQKFEECLDHVISKRRKVLKRLAQ